MSPSNQPPRTQIMPPSNPPPRTDNASIQPTTKNTYRIFRQFPDNIHVSSLYKPQKLIQPTPFAMPNSTKTTSRKFNCDKSQATRAGAIHIKLLIDFRFVIKLSSTMSST